MTGSVKNQITEYRYNCFIWI